MKDKRTGAARKEPVKGAVDKAGKKAMPAPAKKQEAKRPTAKAGTPAPRQAAAPTARTPKPAARPTEKPVRRASDNQGKAGKRPAAGPTPAPTRPTPTKPVARGGAKPAASAAKTGAQSTYMNMLDQMRSQSVAAQTGSALGTKPNIGLGTTPNIGLGSNMNYGFK